MAAQPRTVSVHLLREHDLPEADRILRDAFETFTGIRGLFADKDYVRTRWAADPARAIAAELDGELAGSNFVTLWGSLGFFGPLSVRPSLWDTGIGKALMEATHDLLAAVRHAALFTFSNSPRRSTNAARSQTACSTGSIYPARSAPLRARNLATRCSCAATASRDSPRVTSAREPKRAAADASSSSARCVRAWAMPSSTA